MLPPYDTHATLARLTALAERFRPKTIVTLGDNFHDGEGPARLDATARASIASLMRGRRFVWIEGNHDHAAALALGGECAPELEIGPLVFRHEPADGKKAAGELCGHLHPVARVATRARMLRRRCFVGNGQRCVLPAFGAFTGGLDVFDEAFAPLFPHGFAAYLLGRDRVYPFAHSRLAAE
jgi:DNA ligase-associated metallophosphoesterase